MAFPGAAGARSSPTLSAEDWARFSVLAPAGPEEPAPGLFKKIDRLIFAEHRVVKGEQGAWHLAGKYGTTAMSLQTSNNSELLFLYPGMRVTVHNKVGMLYEVSKATETLDRIVSRTRKKRPALGFKKAIIDANKLPGSAWLGEFVFYRGDRLLLPGIIEHYDTYHFPFKRSGWHRISSRFGTRYHPILRRPKFHDGLDLPKPWGTPVYPSRTGRVIEAGWREGYGLTIVIRHADGATTTYGHLSRIHVKKRRKVKRGLTLIGRVGTSGFSTGPHLHFEVRDRHGRPMDPRTKIGRR